MPTRLRTESPKGKIAQFRDAGAAVLKPLREIQERERRHLRHEISQVRGLMPLLMKPRNQQHWTSAERQELLGQLRSLSALSPYLMLLLLPGAFITLPLFAWWMDLRRKQRSQERQEYLAAKAVQLAASDTTEPSP